MRPFRVISGGQTGVDRAALDAAAQCGIPIGGWCPKGRRAEDGLVPHRYPLMETPSAGYAHRTRWNVRDSDATAVLMLGELSGGSLLTTRVAAKLAKPCLVVDLDPYDGADRLVDFLEGHRVRTLNAGGPRESHRPGIGARAYRIFLEVFGEDERRAGLILR